ncbi:MAG TPA: hypothetical protein VIT91_19540 [Chthoniobacterales bacterium]
MSTSVLPDSKPGLGTAAKALLTLVAVAWIAWVAFLLFRATNKTDEERVSKRVENLAKLNEANVKKLSSYAWIDKAKGTVQIPIDRAIDLTVADLKDRVPVKAGPISTPAPAASPAAVSPVPSAEGQAPSPTVPAP